MMFNHCFREKSIKFLNGLGFIILLLISTNSVEAKIPESLRIIDATVIANDSNSDDVGLGERIKVTIEGDAGDAKDTNNFSFSNLILYLDNRPLDDHTPAPKIIPSSVCIEIENAQIRQLKTERANQIAEGDNAAVANTDEQLKLSETKRENCPDIVYLFYALKRDQDNKDSREVWSALMGSPTGFSRLIEVGVGLQSGEQILPKTGTSPKVELEMLGKFRFGVSAAIFVISLGLFLWLCRASQILCEQPRPLRSSSDKPAYSLGKTQMAWWFFLVLGSYLFIAVATVNYETISAQALILIGIAAGTGFGSIAIDANKTAAAGVELQKDKTELARLQGRQNELTGELAKIRANANNTPEQAAQTVKISEEISEIPEKTNQLTKKVEDLTKSLEGRVSKGFILDIVSDHSGVSFHRFQNVIWSIVLGGAFLFQVWSNLAMPEFSAELLTLMGISSGTYLGFKFPEKK